MSRYLSPAQVARPLGKSPAAIVRLIHSGTLPAIKVGRTYHVAESDLEAFLERARVRPRARGRSPRLEAAIGNHRHDVATRACERAGL